MIDYVGKAEKYAEGVLSGHIPACKWVKLACERQRNDLADPGAYHFDREAGNRICRFIECLQHVKGELAGNPIHLEPWQCFILSTVFGWIRADGGRRFRHVYIEVPRGNAKSTISSGVALYCLCADHEPGAEVYSFATTRDQAKIVFGDAKAMAQGNKALREHFGIEVLANALAVPSTNSTFQAKSAEGSTLDGLNTHLAVVDELHAHKTRAVYDVVETSLGKRRNSLQWNITTAGFDRAGICYEIRTLITKILGGFVDDPTWFGIIYSIDDGDDWKSEAALEKANPNWGISVRPEMVRSLQKKALVTPSAVNNFKTKHLCVWCNADSGWMDMTAWMKCADSSLQLEDFEGSPCYIAMDLASKKDIAALALLFPYMDGKKRRFAAFGEYWLPEQAVREGTNSQYSGWESLGLLHVTPGAINDISSIEDKIRELCERFEVREIAYDPFQATQIAGNLSKDGFPMLEYRQTVQNMSEPMKTLEALVLSGKLRFNGDPVLTWMISNVVCHTDAKDNIYPRKETAANKIDGAVALIMAVGRSSAGDPEPVDFDYSKSSVPAFIEW